MMKTLTSWLLLCALLFVAFGIQSAVAQSGLSRTLVLAVEGSAPTFDPLLSGSDSRVNTPSINMYNALYQFVPGTSEVKPELATSHEVSDDGLAFTFRLRHGVPFQDGGVVTAHDVKYSADRMLALQTGTARNFAALDSVDVIDDHTVRFNLKFPFPPLLLALPRLYVLNSELVRANEQGGDWGQTWLQNHSAGSGPYRLVSFEPEQQFTIERFDDYFLGFPEGTPERAIFRTIREEATRRLALERGDVDWARIGSTDSFAGLANSPGIVRYVHPTLNQLYIAQYVNNQYLSDPRIRTALTLVYDYEGHVELVRSGFGEIARGPLPSAIECFDQSIGYSQTDFERAKQLMAEAGYPDGGFTLSMAYQGTSPEETAAFQIMQAGAAELGIQIRPIPVEWPAKVELFSSETTAPALGTVWEYPAYPDPNIFLFDKMHSSRGGSGGLNFAFFSDPYVDALLESGMVEQDAETRCGIYRELQQIWLREDPYVSISVSTELSAARDYVENFMYTASHAFTVQIYPIRIEGKP